MITIKDIARLSGCSISTVSRVLNNHSDVSEESRKKVLKIVEEQNFVPNSNAKKLKQKPEGIAILVKGANNILFSTILEEIQNVCSASNETTSVFYLHEDENEVRYAKNMMKEIKPEGIIFLGGNLKYFEEEFHEIPVPSTLLTNSAKNMHFPNLSSFTTDDEKACMYMCEYLIQQGHKNIGVVGGNADSSITQVSYRRIRGCEKTFEKHSIHFNERTQYEPCHFSLEESYLATKRLLKRNPSLDAIIAIGDVIAIGARRAIEDANLNVPQDISLTGYDGLEITQYSVPRITTIRQDAKVIGQKGTEELLRRIHIHSKPVNEVIPFQFLEGESVKKKEKRK